MADRYWVLGGSGDWYSTTNWSATSGGASGASVPTTGDNVIFNSSLNASPSIYVTISSYATAYCANLNFTGYTGLVYFQMGSSSNLELSGNLTLSNNLTMLNGGVLVLAGIAKTITSNSKIINCSMSVSSGASYTLADALSQTSPYGGLTINGTFTTAGYTLLVDSVLVSPGATLTLNTSAVTIKGSFEVNSGGTFNCGTSTITFSDSYSVSIIGSYGVATTFYNVVLYGIRASSTFLYGLNTFNNLTILSQTISAFTGSKITISYNQTINGTLTIQSTGTPENRMLIASDVDGTQKTIYVNALAAGAGNCNFSDIAITGPASPISGTSFGDAKGNSGITFTAAKTVYWVGGTGNAYDTTRWATSSGGAGAAANYPLPQDSVIINDSSGVSGSTMTFAANAGNNNQFYITDITMTARTLSFTINGTIYYYGNLTIPAAATTSSATFLFYGRTSQQVTTNGKTLYNISVGLGTTLTMQDSLTIQYTISNYGTLTTNNYNITQTATTGGGYYGYQNSTLNMGTSLCTFAGYGAWSDFVLSRYYIFFSDTNTTITGSGTLSLTGSDPTYGKVLQIRGTCSPITINQGGSGRLYMYALNNNVTYQDITNTYATTGATSIYFLCASTTVLKVNNFSLAGTSGKLCTITNTIYSGRANIRKPSGAWYVGANSINGGQVSGAAFTAGGASDYLSISKINFTVEQSGFMALV